MMDKKELAKEIILELHYLRFQKEEWVALREGLMGQMRQLKRSKLKYKSAYEKERGERKRIQELLYDVKEVEHHTAAAAAAAGGDGWVPYSNRKEKIEDAASPNNIKEMARVHSWQVSKLARQVQNQSIRLRRYKSVLMRLLEESPLSPTRRSQNRNIKSKKKASYSKPNSAAKAVAKASSPFRPSPSLYDSSNIHKKKAALSSSPIREKRLRSPMTRIASRRRKAPAAPAAALGSANNTTTSMGHHAAAIAGLKKRAMDEGEEEEDLSQARDLRALRMTIKKMLLDDDDDEEEEERGVDVLTLLPLPSRRDIVSPSSSPRRGGIDPLNFESSPAPAGLIIGLDQIKRRSRPTADNPSMKMKASSATAEEEGGGFASSSQAVYMTKGQETRRSILLAAAESPPMNKGASSATAEEIEGFASPQAEYMARVQKDIKKVRGSLKEMKEKLCPSPRQKIRGW